MYMEQHVSNIVLPLSKLVPSDYLRVNHAPHLENQNDFQTVLHTKKKKTR
jgi:hypothetical protein